MRVCMLCCESVVCVVCVVVAHLAMLKKTRIEGAYVCALVHVVCAVNAYVCVCVVNAYVYVVL